MANPAMSLIGLDLAEAVAMLEWTPPPQIDEYRIVRPLGRGGMGEVFVGHDTLLDRAVAVKFIARDPDELTRQRFAVEARAAARLQHPNVVTVFRVGDCGGRPFLVSELIRGRSLDQLPRPRPWDETLRIGVDLARGLAAAHRHHVLHRDIKPGNAILADDGVAKLLDFGLAKLLDGAPAADRGRGVPALRLAAGSVDDTMPAASNGDAADPGASLPPSSGELTVEGALLGTPYYMAPEVLQGHAASPRSDVYSLGALLYELLAGAAPNRHVPIVELIRTVRTVDPAPLAEVHPDVDPRMAAIVDRCVRRDPAERFASGDELREALEQLAAPRRAAPPDGNPYRGLATFEPEHRAVFFGRAAEVRAVVDRLRGESLVVIAGESGVGKSSLVRAGVIPELVDGALGDGRAWSVVTTVPGRRPALALAAALGLDDVAGDPAAAARALRARASVSRGTIVLIDQLEELLTLGDPVESAAVARLLGELAVPVPGVRVIATVRGDFLARLGALPGLGAELSRALYLLRPLDDAGLRDAITAPALAAGFRFADDRLVDQLLADAAGSLPLLQFALAELWNQRDVERRVIRPETLAAIGGVAGALGRHADAVIDPLLPDEAAAARRIIVALITAERTRSRASLVELGGDAATAAALDRLVRGRLVVARGGEPPSYELIHEALIRQWQRLHGWLDDDAGARAIAARIRRAAEEWERLGRSRDALLGARQLVEADGVPADALGEREQALVAASRAARRRRRRRQLGAAVVVPLLAVAVIGGVRLRDARAQAARIDEQLGAATRALVAARARAGDVRALEQQAYARFDASDTAGGEALWTQAATARSERDRLYSDATAAAEAGLLLDASHPASRAMVADVLADRVRLARGTPAEAELATRLALYDDDRSRRARLAAPALLRVVSDPPGAALEIAGPDGAITHARAGDDVALAPGSYRVTLRAPGRADVVYPLLLDVAETLTVPVALPAPDDVPDGFVYVPAGRFLYGSAADDERRRDFIVAAPIHPVELGAFLIARHETTFGDWIAFLEALPADERAARTPHDGGTGMNGAVALDGGPGTWRLRLKPGATPLTAALGEPLRYPARTRDADHDWRRLPVSGIDHADATAYAAWLDRTGRVPGARLCDELEWERAARGADGRTFPHGATLRPGDANFDATHGGDAATWGPDEVGRHPASRSPFGVDDLAGNVFEWTRTQVLRGGSFGFDPNPARTDFRELVGPTVRDITVGMRVCADVSRSRP